MNYQNSSRIFLGNSSRIIFSRIILVTKDKSYQGPFDAAALICLRRQGGSITILRLQTHEECERQGASQVPFLAYNEFSIQGSY